MHYGTGITRERHNDRGGPRVIALQVPGKIDGRHQDGLKVNILLFRNLASE